MKDNYFLDTNIFIYLFTNDTGKKDISLKLVTGALQNRTGKISTQVVQEFLNVGIRKYSDRISEFRYFLQAVLNPLCEVFPDADLFAIALDIHQETHYSFYDSLIIAAALRGNCRVLYTEDMQSGQSIRGLEIVNPYLPGAKLIQ